MSQDPSKPVTSRLAAGLIVVFCVLFVGYFVLPKLAGSQRAKLPEILGNLRQIDLAKQMWASDYAATNGATITEQDLVAYLRPRPGSTGLVGSVDSELYRLNAIGTPAEAQLQRAFGSRFPKGTLVRWSTNVGCEILLPNSQAGPNAWQPLYADTNWMSPTTAPRHSP